MTLLSRSSLLSALAGALVMLAMVAAALTVQHARRGWPFASPQGEARSVALDKQTRAAHDASSHASRSPVTVDTTQFERLGIQFETAQLEQISSTARYPAIVTPDEGRISHVHTRVSGWVEQLHVNTTGEQVRVGQPLAAVFSQDLLASQTEYLTALKRMAPGSAVLDAARSRLRVLGMSDRDISELERAGSARRLVLITAPRSGIVLRRAITVGTAVDPSTELMTLADLTRVWILAEVPESEAARIRVGTSATLSFPGSGRAPFSSPVQFIYPTLTERTRTVRVRFSIANTDAALRPGLYGTATFDAQAHESLTVAREAVVDTGQSQHVFVRRATGVLEARNVTLGARLGERVEVLNGIAPGEEIVTAGVFLIDSESRLRASGGGAGHAGHGQNTSAGEDNAAKQPAETAHSKHGT